ncbi:MAG: glycoside hydrolase family 3 C-terminal domain-containing protein [Capsulimonadaceae bacterium]|nr:glycoside hydrolase family 3 C-terminal domain-containing protein [Capsulimonadaceae bacterium]
MTSSAMSRLPRLFAAICVAIACACPSPSQSAPAPLYKNPKAPLEARVNDLFKRLTQEEKLSLLTGTGFSTTPILRLDVPALQMADAGQGVRGGGPGTTGPATLFPAGITMASTWEPEMVGEIGKSIGEEALNKGPGIQLMLGPAMNIHRSPLCGRNGEYFSEDPFLASRLAVGYIEGMQATGCAACAKHYAVNNEEVDRGFVNVSVSERALREIYLPAFEASTREAHVVSVMAAYNKIYGNHLTASRYLLTDILKGDWGWDGMVMSDWGAVHETAGVVNAGNDLEMPGKGFLLPEKVAAAIADGKITQAQVDENVHRVLRAILRARLLDGPPHVPDHTVINSQAHRNVAFKAACRGIVLLKNEGNLLPLDSSKIHSIAVIGPAATNMQFGAAGSPGLTPVSSVEPLDGITARAGANVTINAVEGRQGTKTIPASAFTTPDGLPGLKAQYFANEELNGTPVVTRIDPNIDFDWGNSAVPAPGVKHDHFSVRWTGKFAVPTTGVYEIAMSADDGCRVFLDGHSIIHHWEHGAAFPHAKTIMLTKGRTYNLRVDYFQGTGLASANLGWVQPGEASFTDAAAAAAKSDVAIVIVSTLGTEGEGTDRPSMDLPNGEDQLIAAVSAANKRTIVVLNNGTPITLLPWLKNIPALLESWFPGEEGGHALAAILFGDVNPSGKLPDTLAAAREDYPDNDNFPGVHGQVHYEEGIYVGYRHFDKKNIEPVFPFGYGLSYTTFQYANLRLSSPSLSPNGKVNALVDITNTGSKAGAEVVELYIHDPAPKIDKPVRELKGFEKIDLEPGQTKTVSIPLAGRSFAYCDVPGKQWKADKGTYDVEVGASSRDIRLTARLTLDKDFTEPVPHMTDTPLVPVVARDPNRIDLAKGHPAAASSEQEADTPASSAFDGDDTSRWSSLFSDPQWLRVDLEKPTEISSARLYWETAYASSYRIQTSLDGNAWTDVYATTKGAGDEEIVHFAPVTTRYVRLFCEKRGTQYGYSVYSFELYAK